jgi:hypothetical protein
MQARSTTNGKIRREIQNPQMFETDPESFSPAIYFRVEKWSEKIFRIELLSFWAIELLSFW